MAWSFDIFPMLTHEEKVSLFESTLEHYHQETERLIERATGDTRVVLEMRQGDPRARSYIFSYMGPLLKEYKRTYLGRYDPNNLTGLFVTFIQNRGWDAFTCASQIVPLCFPEYVAAILISNGILSLGAIQEFISFSLSENTLTVGNIVTGGLVTWNQLLDSIRTSLRIKRRQWRRIGGFNFSMHQRNGVLDEDAFVLLYSINNVQRTDRQQQDILCLLPDPSEEDVQIILNACMFGPQQYFASAHFNPRIFTLSFCKRWLATSSMYWPIVKQLHCITELPCTFEFTKASVSHNRHANRRQYVGDDLWTHIGAFMDPMDTLFDDVATILPIRNANMLGRGLSIFADCDWELLTSGAITDVSHLSKKYELLEACLRNAPIQTLFRLKALGYTGVMSNIEYLSENAFVAHTIVSLALTKSTCRKEVKTFVVNEWGQLLRQFGCDVVEDENHMLWQFRCTGDTRENSLPPCVFMQSYTFFEQLIWDTACMERDQVIIQNRLQDNKEKEDTGKKRKRYDKDEKNN